MGKKVTAGREQLGAFAPQFAELNDDIFSVRYGVGKRSCLQEIGV